MKTGAHLKIQSFGSNVLGVRLEGNPRKPEPDEFRVSFPGGDVSITRCTDGTYWAHVRVDHEDASLFDPSSDTPARITEARLDIAGKSVLHGSDIGAFNDDGLYHVAFRIAKISADQGKQTAK